MTASFSLGLDAPDGEPAQPDTGIMRMACQAPTATAGGLVLQLKAEGQDERHRQFKLAPFGRTFLVHHMPGSPPTSPSKQSGQRELSHGLCPIPVRSSVWWDTSAGTITPALDLMQFVIDHAVTRVPHLP